ncbi:Hypothetical protein CINCED_3A006936 [Cinara cedri]|uniref:Uncharacterized protein n=1 Tax=Cinara cedri TaxID=506608 RepID=A0A5E4MF38_9HEMI|nr:Hypothetical protein CINCED_3A006936 [Cinara cedri]
MQFALPFVKTNMPTAPGNMPPVNEQCNSQSLIDQNYGEIDADGNFIMIKTGFAGRNSDGDIFGCNRWKYQEWVVGLKEMGLREGRQYIPSVDLDEDSPEDVQIPVEFLRDNNDQNELLRTRTASHLKDFLSSYFVKPWHRCHGSGISVYSY